MYTDKRQKFARGEGKCLCYLVFNFFVYICFIGIYARLSEHPILFPASCFFSCVISLSTYLIFRKKLQEEIDILAQHLLVFCSILMLVIFSIFGPVFIDRSISYHLAFIAVEQGEINKYKLDQTGYTEAVFNKRYADAKATGFIERTSHDGVYIPTFKAKLIYSIMMPLGKITGTLREYESLRNSMNSIKHGGDD